MIAVVLVKVVGVVFGARHVANNLDNETGDCLEARVNEWNFVRSQVDSEL